MLGAVTDAAGGVVVTVAGISSGFAGSTFGTFGKAKSDVRGAGLAGFKLGVFVLTGCGSAGITGGGNAVLLCFAGVEVAGFVGDGGARVAAGMRGGMCRFGL
jgi:hypothetical protein